MDTNLTQGVELYDLHSDPGEREDVADKHPEIALALRSAYDAWFSEVAERWQIWRAEKTKREGEGQGTGIASASIFAALTRKAPDDAILCVDVGNNTYSFGRYFECERQAVLMSGYLGSIGFGFPAAMGAWAATQEDDPRFQGRKVISV